MHLLHRSSVFGGGGGRAQQRGPVGSSPRAVAPPRQHRIFSKSDSIKKRSGGAKGSKRARLRAGLAAALQELRLGGGRHKRGSPLSAVDADAATRAMQPSSGQLAQHVACRAADSAAAAAAGPPCAPAAFRSPDWTTMAGGGGGALLLLLAVLALVCVVALGRAPAVCCCTCAAWWCRSRCAAGTTATGHRQAQPPERRALK